MAASIGSLVAELSANTAAFHRDLGKATSALNSNAAKMNSTLASLDRGFSMVSRTVIALAGPVALGALAKRQIEVGSELEKLKQITGVSVETLSAWQKGAELANVSSEQLAVGLRQLANFMRMAAIQPTGEASQAFKQLAVDVVDSGGKLRSIEAVFRDIAERSQRMQDGVAKAGTLTKLLGESGARLVPLLNNLDAFETRARAAGAIVSDEFANDAAAFADNLNDMKSNIDGFIRTAIHPFIKAVNALFDALNRADKVSLQRLLDEQQELARRIEESSFGSLYDDDSLTGDLMRMKEVERAIESLRAKLGDDTAMPKGTSPFDPAMMGLKEGEFIKLLQSLKKETARAQTDILADEQSKSAARRELAKSEWLFKAEQARLGTDQMRQFSQALADWENAQRELDKQAEITKATADLETLRARFDAEYAAKLEYKEQLRLLDETYWILGIEQDATYHELREQMDLEHLARLGSQHAQAVLERRKFEQMNAVQQTQFVLGQLLQLTQGAAIHNKKMFQLNKMAGVAHALINTYQGVTKALAAYPPPISFVMAAAQLAAGMAQVQAIRSANFGTSTSAASIGGGGAIPVTPAADFAALPSPVGKQTQPRIFNITLSGSGRYSAEEIRDLLDQMNEESEDGAGEFNVILT